MQASVAEEGSPIGMLNVAFMLQHGLGYGAPDRHALAYDLLLRAARLERYYGDGLVDAAAIMYDGDRYACYAFQTRVAFEPSRSGCPHLLPCCVLYLLTAYDQWPWQECTKPSPNVWLTSSDSKG